MSVDLTVHLLTTVQEEAKAEAESAAEAKAKADSQAGQSSAGPPAVTPAPPLPAQAPPPVASLAQLGGQAPPLTVKPATVQPIEGAAKPAAPSVPASPAGPTPAAKVEGPEEQIRKAISASPVTGLEELRKAVPQLEGKAFDEHILRLADEGKIQVFSDESPERYTPEERERLVSDEHGNLYNSAAVRDDGPWSKPFGAEPEAAPAQSPPAAAPAPAQSQPEAAPAASEEHQELLDAGMAAAKARKMPPGEHREYAEKYARRKMAAATQEKQGSAAPQAPAPAVQKPSETAPAPTAAAPPAPPEGPPTVTAAPGGEMPEPGGAPADEERAAQAGSVPQAAPAAGKPESISEVTDRALRNIAQIQESIVKKTGADFRKRLEEFKAKQEQAAAEAKATVDKEIEEKTRQATGEQADDISEAVGAQSPDMDMGDLPEGEAVPSQETQDMVKDFLGSGKKEKGKKKDLSPEERGARDASNRKRYQAARAKDDPDYAEYLRRKEEKRMRPEGPPEAESVAPPFDPAAEAQRAMKREGEKRAVDTERRKIDPDYKAEQEAKEKEQAEREKARAEREAKKNAPQKPPEPFDPLKAAQEAMDRQREKEAEDVARRAIDPKYKAQEEAKEKAAAEREAKRNTPKPPPEIWDRPAQKEDSLRRHRRELGHAHEDMEEERRDDEREQRRQQEEASHERKGREMADKWGGGSISRIVRTAHKYFGRGQATGEEMFPGGGPAEPPGGGLGSGPARLPGPAYGPGGKPSGFPAPQRLGAEGLTGEAGGMPSTGRAGTEGLTATKPYGPPGGGASLPEGAISAEGAGGASAAAGVFAIAAVAIEEGIKKALDISAKIFQGATLVMSMDSQKFGRSLADATEKIPIFGKEISNFTHTLLEMHAAIGQQAEQMGKYNGGLAADVANEHVRTIMRDLNRANKFGPEMQGLYGQHTAVNTKMDALMDRLMPLAMKLAERGMEILEWMVDALTKMLEIGAAGLDALLEIWQKMPGARNEKIDTIQDLLFEIANNTKPDDADTASAADNLIAEFMAMAGDNPVAAGVDPRAAAAARAADRRARRLAGNAAAASPAGGGMGTGIIGGGVGGLGLGAFRGIIGGGL